MRMPWKCAPYADLLGRECWAKFGKRAFRCRIVAVSWKGAVCVRRASDIEDGDSKWICKMQRDKRVWLTKKDVPSGLEICE